MFKQFADVVSFVAAAILVIVMQLDSFELLSKLSDNKEYRESLVEYAPRVVGRKPETVQPFHEAMLSVNESFVEKHVAEFISVEQLGGEENDSADDAFKEFQLILSNSSNPSESQDQLMTDYKAEINKAYMSWQKENQKVIESQYAALLEFDFKPFPNSWSFDDYIERFFGLLLSAILISLGAPFWFNTLKKVVGFKDAVAMQFDQSKLKYTGRSQ